jgi:hypothetical protein
MITVSFIIRLFVWPAFPAPASRQAVSLLFNSFLRMPDVIFPIRPGKIAMTCEIPPTRESLALSQH